ncbi:hypothetical protein ACOMHN_030723 [Nucella lapillus]
MKEWHRAPTTDTLLAGGQGTTLDIRDLYTWAPPCSAGSAEGGGGARSGVSGFAGVSWRQLADIWGGGEDSDVLTLQPSTGLYMVSTGISTDTRPGHIARHIDTSFTQHAQKNQLLLHH